ncbi:MAG: NAD-dependent epimerase/dehydratase family protein [Sphingomicrobium sp.]
MAKGADSRPIVLITGAAGNIGTSLAEVLTKDYRVVGLDRPGTEADFPLIEADLADDESVDKGMREFRKRFGDRIASVVHLAAFFDFSGEDNPLYEQINVEGTKRLLRALQPLQVEQFLYSGTMLVHAPCDPGESMDEDQPIEPQWAYPKSKAEAEEVIRAEAGDIPYVLLHLAGLYDEKTAVPTLAHQIARIYERDFQSHFYSGSTRVGQSMVHRDDMLDAFKRAIDRRRDIPSGTVILIGEEDAPGYDALQDEIGYLIHGSEDWPTLRVPKPAAAAGAWLMEKTEPIVPDALDQGEEPFVKPFMVRMADDHYELDISRARKLLGWEPKHNIKDMLPKIVAALTNDPKGWYEKNGLTPPATILEVEKEGEDPERVRAEHERLLVRQHRRFRWAHFANIFLGLWLMLQPPMIGVGDPLLAWTEAFLGAGTILFATLSLSWRLSWARWITAGIGALVMAAPFVLWTDNNAAFLSDTLVGGLIMAFAVGSRPEVGPSPLAATSGQYIPPGWDYNPSTWTQRLPIIALAVLGLEVSRYLTAYQLGLIDGVWEPFFAGSPADPQNGTEEIITSDVSEAWPVPDAAVGGYTYALEIITGIVGSKARWRTMPWLVVLFGLMIVPLGVVSITFIIIQPIVIGTWSTLTLVAAAAMLIQIPYSIDELLATLQFVRRRVNAGKSWLRVFLFGDTDEGPHEKPAHEFSRRPGEILTDMWSGGVNLPWNLALAGLVGIWLTFTRLSLGAEPPMAHADHLIGALALTVVSLSAAEVTRALRFLLIPLGAALFVTAFLFGAGTEQTIASFVSGALLIVLSLRRGPIHCRYGSWHRWIV